MLRELARRRPWLAFILSYYGFIAVVALLFMTPFVILVIISQFLYGGPPPWWS